MKDEIAVICANVQYNNYCHNEVFEIVNSLYGFEKANKIVLALDDEDVCLNCVHYDTTFPSGVERDEPQCLNQHSCCCGQAVTKDYGCKFFKSEKSPFGSSFRTEITEDGFIHIHERVKDNTLVDTIRPIDIPKVWEEPNVKYGELLYSVPRDSNYILTLYTGGGGKSPSCALCGTILPHVFSSCPNKNCVQHKNYKRNTVCL